MASRSQTDQQSQSVDIGELLAELAIKIERLKVLYEQYFMGIEKMEPQVARKEVTRAMLLLQQQYIRNTALRFKFNTMLQKWNIYITYWNRILREIENGTYTRHLAKARRKAEQLGRELPQEIAAAAKKLLRGSGTFDAIEDTSESPPRFLDNETGAQNAFSGSADDAELEQVWDRITGADPKRRPPPTPPPGTLAAILPAALTGRDKMLAELAAAKAKALADLEARRPRPAVPAVVGKPDSGPNPRSLPPPPMPPLPASAERSVPIAVDKDPSGPIRRATLPPPPPPMARAAVPPPPPRQPPPPAQLPKIPGMNDADLRALHQRYVDAQRQSGTQASVKYETLVNSLAKQVPQVLKQPGVKGVRFDVSVQDGRPILKAIPQK